MLFIKIFLVIILISYLLAVFVNLRKIKKPVKFWGIQIAVTLFLFAIINLTSFATKQYIPLNEATVFGSFIGGVPFLVLVLLANTIFIL